MAHATMIHLLDQGLCRHCSHGGFRLFDPRLKITRVELGENVSGVDRLVVDDVDGQDRAIDLRTQSSPGYHSTTPPPSGVHTPWFRLHSSV
jgi:hypothetical protein